MSVGLIAGAVVVAIALFWLHRQAAMRVFAATEEGDDRDSAPLRAAEEATPALVLSETLSVGVVVALLASEPALGGYARIGLCAMGLVVGLLVPLRARVPGAGPTPAWIRLLARRGNGAGEAEPGRNGRRQPSTGSDPLGERSLVDRMIRFRETEIAEVMVPRTDVVAVDAEGDVRTLLGLVEEHRHSRYPVVQGDLDHVTGYVNVFELLALEPGTLRFDPAVRQPMLVPESKTSPELLDDMLTASQEFAIVVDEFGGTAGVVTAEDLVEELIGEIWDEHERADVKLRRVGVDTYVVDATIPVNELADGVGLSLPEGDYETLAGFLLEQFGRIPVRGDRVDWEGAAFEVLTADRRRIDSVQIVTRRDGTSRR